MPRKWASRPAEPRSSFAVPHGPVGKTPRRAGWGILALYLSAPFLLAGLAFILRKPLLALSRWFPTCLFYALTGWYCPGCGNTRSVRALLEGDFLLSLRYNITPMLLLLAILLLYVEWGTALFGRPRKLLPRTVKFWAPFGVLIAVYWVARNAFPLPL